MTAVGDSISKIPLTFSLEKKADSNNGDTLLASAGSLSLQKGSLYNSFTLPESLKAKMIEVGVWKPGCPVDVDRLRLVQFTHFDFSGKEQQGEIVVLEAIVKRTVHVFETLHRYKFPIAQAKTIEKYNGMDKPSMAANNTSAFNYRVIAGKTFLSVHSYGVAIDVNPVQNPCIEQRTIPAGSDGEEILLPVQPAAGQAYLNRTNVRPGMVEQQLDASTGLRVVELFKQNGFHVWGGGWNDPVDWQHFQPSRATAEWLAFMTPKDGTLLFEQYIANPTLLNDPKVRDFDFKALYTKDPEQFMNALQSTDFWKMSPQLAYDYLKS